LLAETLVDIGRYAGTCYRAANWICVGETSGRGRMDLEHLRHGAAVKRLFLYPLAKDARRRLIDAETDAQRISSNMDAPSKHLI
jgi:hypothetical protein